MAVAGCEGQLLELEEATDHTEADLPRQHPGGRQRKVFLGVAAAILVAGAVALGVTWSRPEAITGTEVQSKGFTELASKSKCKYGVQKIDYENYLPTKKYSYSANCNEKNRVITVCFNHNGAEWYGMGGELGSPCADKLENKKLFGPAGKVKYPIKTVMMKGTITAKGLAKNKCDIFHIGLADKDAFSKLTYTSLSKTSTRALKTWAKDDYHVILGFQSFATAFGKYGEAETGATNPMTATKLGAVVTEKGAPFGAVGSFQQGGSWRGTLTKLDKKACVLIQDATKKPVAVLDTNLGSVFLSDTDLLTTLGGITKGKDIGSANDKLLGNLYAFMTGITCNGAPSNCKFQDTPVEICKPKPKGEAAVIVSFMFVIKTKIEISVLVTSASFMKILKVVFAAILKIDISMITKIQLVEWQGQLQVILGFGCGCSTKIASKFEATFKSKSFFTSFASQLRVRYSQVTLTKMVTVTSSVYTSVTQMTTAFKVYGTQAVSCTMDLGITSSYSISKLITITSFKMAFIKVMALRLKIMTSMVQVSFQQVGSKLQAVLGIIGVSSTYSASFKATISQSSFVSAFVSSVTKQYREIQITGSIKINVQVFTSIFKMTQSISIFGGLVAGGGNGGSAAVAATCSLSFASGWKTTLVTSKAFISLMTNIIVNLLEVKASTVSINLKTSGGSGLVATYAIKDCSTTISQKLQVTFQTSTFMNAMIQQINLQYTALVVAKFQISVTVYSSYQVLVTELPCGCIGKPSAKPSSSRRRAPPPGGRLLGDEVQDAEEEEAEESEEEGVLSSLPQTKVFTLAELAEAQNITDASLLRPAESENDAALEELEENAVGDDADTGPEDSIEFVVNSTELEIFQEPTEYNEELDNDDEAEEDELNGDADEEEVMDENDEVADEDELDGDADEEEVMDENDEVADEEGPSERGDED
eukprot:TRINITY_DN5876_c0_g1_i1.p1 TRINITY_DN5876_c0_g1~~TRINITY_DN5876_c0_g1_i1.p1  ORF type:complete len:933 (+),score=210.82 TRINITY_DN5876_c0_g1_i1:41-2839(+)